MDKNILKKIAKEWSAGILFHGTGTDSFLDLLDQDEAGYIVEQVQKIALRIVKGDVPDANLENIIKRHYTIEE